MYVCQHFIYLNFLVLFGDDMRIYQVGVVVGTRLDVSTVQYLRLDSEDVVLVLTSHVHIFQKYDSCRKIKVVVVV